MLVGLRADAGSVAVWCRSLESGLSEMGLQVEVARSDEEFAAKHMHDYRLIILDSWTWVSAHMPATQPGLVAAGGLLCSSWCR